MNGYKVIFGVINFDAMINECFRATSAQGLIFSCFFENLMIALKKFLFKISLPPILGHRSY